MFWTLLDHRQGAHKCIKWLLIILSDEGQKGLKHVQLVLYYSNFNKTVHVG
jgi:hypothetical protein